jgi:pilus assembly protein CpaF
MVDDVKVKNFLVATLSRTFANVDVPTNLARVTAAQHLDQIYAKTGLQLPDSAREKLYQEVLDELIGFGPIQPLLDDPEISDIMVNGPDQVFIERNGEILKTEVYFENNEHVFRLIERILTPLGKCINQDHPTIDARLPDGSRVVVIIPPASIDGPVITIRKSGKQLLTIEHLIERASITESMAEFLHACVASRLNIIISGGKGSGKTTLLNILASYIPDTERILTIDDSGEIQLQQDHIVRLETKTPSLDGCEDGSTRELLRIAFRMRPDRIVMSEINGREALDLLQAMNSGLDGVLTTINANNPREVVSQLETLILLADPDMTARMIRGQIASAMDLIIQQTRLRDGTRKTTQITELAGMQGDTIVLTDIFKYDQSGYSPDGRVIGDLKPTGIRPLFTNRLEQAGFKLKAEIFGVNVAELLSQGQRGARSR